MKYIKSLLIVATIFLSGCGHSPDNGTRVQVIIDEKIVCEGIVIGGTGDGGSREHRVEILILENNIPTDRKLSIPQSFVKVVNNVEK